MKNVFQYIIAFLLLTVINNNVYGQALQKDIRVSNIVTDRFNQLLLNIDTSNLVLNDINEIKNSLNKVIDNELNKNFHQDTCRQLFITAENLYMLLIEGLNDSNHYDIQLYSTRMLLKYGNKEVLFNLTNNINSNIDFANNKEIGFFFNLSVSEKDSLLNKVDLFGRAFLGDELAEAELIDSFVETENATLKEKLAIQLGTIKSKKSIEALVLEFNKEYFISDYNQYFSTKYYSIIGLSYAFSDEKIFVCDFYKTLNKYALYRDETRQFSSIKNKQKQNEYIDSVRIWINNRFKLSLPQSNKDSFLMITEEIEFE